MGNMLDYIRWRGDLPWSCVPFCEVDGLILSQLSMLFWEEGLGCGECRTLCELWPRMKGKPFSVGVTADNDNALLEKAAGCARFSCITLSDYASQFNEKTGLQFSAVAMHLPDSTIFVSYRGTDNTLVGWKEDLCMTFSLPVPAQEAAAAYLREVACRYGGSLRVGGHSKGGNLAMYASAVAEAKIRRRILQVYNNDGPGFKDSAKAHRFYEKIKNKLRFFVPQSSLFGLLLAHPCSPETVKSDGFGIWQHDPYSWQVEGGRFVRMESLTKSSMYAEAAIQKWLSEVSDEDRSLFVESIFRVLSSTEARSFGRDFWMGLLQHPAAVVSSFQDIDPDTKKRVAGILSKLARAALPDMSRRKGTGGIAEGIKVSGHNLPEDEC